MPPKKKSVRVPVMDSVMLDLETFGTLPGDVFCSIGAVEFELATGELGREFYQVIDLQSALDVGLKVRGATIEWWLKQSDAARAEILKNKVPIQKALHDFALWFNPKLTIWGNGLGFDVSMLKMGYEAIKFPHPWRFDNERDVRTWVAENSIIKKEMKFVGTRHEPIADCKHQIKYMVETRNWSRKQEVLQIKK